MAMKQLSVPGFFSWSVFSAAKQMDFNGHFWARPGGNVLFDPPVMSEDDQKHVDTLGGVRLCVLTNADHLRDVMRLKQRFGFDVVAHALDAQTMDVPVGRRVQHGDEIVPGLFAVHLKHGKTPGEFACWMPREKTVLVGDVLQGAPVGALRLPPEEKLESPAKAVLELRKILRLPVENLLVGDGHSLFGNVREAILACVEGRDDIDIHHVSPRDLNWQAAESEGPYQHEIKELSRLVGARKLAYNLRRLPPGTSTGPIHFHRAEEELFVVLEGRCDLVSPRGTTPLDTGDVVACPPGELGAHTLTNHSDAPCVVLCLSDVVPFDEREQTGIVDFRYDLVTP